MQSAPDTDLNNHQLPGWDLSDHESAEEQQAAAALEPTYQYESPEILPTPISLLGAADPSLVLPVQMFEDIVISEAAVFYSSNYITTNWQQGWLFLATAEAVQAEPLLEEGQTFDALAGGSGAQEDGGNQLPAPLAFGEPSPGPRAQPHAESDTGLWPINGETLAVAMGVINGTDGDDYLVGTAADDTIHGLGGNDTVNGIGGDDTIDGGDGNDYLYGDTGTDSLLGGDGNDYFNEVAEGDLIDGGKIGRAHV